MLQFYLSLADNDGDRDKLEYIYTHYYGLMFAVAIKYAHNEETARDVIHDAMLKVIPHLPKIDMSNPQRLKNFLCVVVKHRAIDVLRRNNALPTSALEDVDFSLNDPSPTPVEQLLSMDGYNQILSCINQMSDTYRSVCELKYIGEMTESQIAETLHLSPKAVNSRIFRAKQILKSALRGNNNHGR